MQLSIDTSTTDSYNRALAEYNKYATSQRDAVFLVYCEKTSSYATFPYSSRKRLESYKSFKIVKSSDRVN